MQSLSRGQRLKLSVSLCFVVALVVIAMTVDIPTQPELREMVERWGTFAPVAFGVIYAVLTLLPIPKSVCTIAAGVIFGFWQGFALVAVSATVGATAAFLLARLMGRDVVERLLGKRIELIDQYVSRYGLFAVIVLRLIPLVPFTAFNYGAGFTALRMKHYLVGTALGILPGVATYVAVGAYGSNPTSWPFILAIATFVGLLALVKFSPKSRRKLLPSNVADEAPNSH